jgi:hypothetical protein
VESRANVNERQRFLKRRAFAVARAWIGASPRPASLAAEPEYSEAIAADRDSIAASFAWRVIDSPTLRLAPSAMNAPAPVTCA